MPSTISPTRSRDKVLQSLYEADVGSNLLDYEKIQRKISNSFYLNQGISKVIIITLLVMGYY